MYDRHSQRSQDRLENRMRIRTTKGDRYTRSSEAPILQVCQPFSILLRAEGVDDGIQIPLYDRL